MPARSYLNAKSAAKGQTADAVALGDLHFTTPDVEHPRRVLAALPVKHVNEKAALCAEHELCFPKWRFLLRRGAYCPAGRVLLARILINILHIMVILYLA